ncbi:helix-turn-helix transcriptional regulator [Streptomyces synnematoformans]|uniref:Helix-turn-helix transcriptional regulator n=1 Tax=Streptomyces synnematoformans TaxID=415721 RepID=A0ABN2XA52_9ACTN
MAPRSVRDLTMSRRVGEEVQRLRLQAGMTRSDLMRRTHELGRLIPASSILDIERGFAWGGSGRSVSVDELYVLAAALDVSPLELLEPGRAGAAR